MSLTALLEKLKNNQSINFEESMTVIAENYDYQTAEFSNGLGDDKFVNQAGTNEGSCKVFAFAKLNHLDDQQTLLLFGEHYRGVLSEPNGTSHPNIRNFMKYGWDGIHFSNDALVAKA